MWKVSDKLSCPHLKPFNQVCNITLPLDKFKHVYRAEKKQLGINMHLQATRLHSVFLKILFLTLPA